MYSNNDKKDLTNDEKVFIFLLKNVSDSKKIDENKVIISKYNLTIEFKIIRIKEYEKLIMSEIAFLINHDYFDEPLVEVTSGVEENLDDSINQCVAGFSSSVLNVVIKALNNKVDKDFEGDFFNEKKKYSLTKGNIITIGEREQDGEPDFWSMLGEKIKIRLGNKKLYLVKVYASKLKSGDLSCECRINGIINNDITNYIKDYTNDWNIKTNFSSLKQFFVIKQKDETYIKYPHSKDEIIEFTHKTIKILAECRSEEQYNNIDKDIIGITEDANVAYEIKCFIPEIFCELLFNDAQYSNKIILVENNEQIEGYKGQFTIYYWVYECVLNIFNAKILSEQELKTIISLSASYNAIAEAITKGDNLKDLNNILVGMRRPVGYKPL